MDREDVCVLLPTLDEAETIADVIEGFHEEGFDNILVIDGHSTDDTREIAREHGARVITQSGSGKGQAIREAMDHIDATYVLMADADGTYRPEEAEKMLKPLIEGDAEHVIGNRFADIRDGAMTRFNMLGNFIFNKTFRYIHGEDLKDILSGYRAFTRASFERLALTSEGFGIETEMSVECVKRNIPVAVVPITYLPRPSGSSTNLHPIRDGGIIFLELYRRAKTSNPLFYFGSIGSVSTGVGVALGIYVGFEWFTQNISHEVLAVVSAFAILFGVQLLMFGMLSDLIVTLHREMMQKLEDDDSD